jgi:hypothetical protein
MISARRRLLHYTQKTIPTRVKEDFEKKLPRMTTGFAGQTNILCTDEDFIHGILAGYDIYTADYPKYLSFGHMIRKVQQRHVGGTGATVEYTLLKNRWEARGADPDALDDILDGILATVPLPPPGAFAQLLPANHAVNVPVSGNLTWGVAAGGFVLYDILLDTVSPPITIYATDITILLKPYTLASGTHYYWRVTAHNVGGATPSNALFDFTTIVAP